VRALFPELSDANLTEHGISFPSVVDVDAASWRPVSCLAWDLELRVRGLDIDAVLCDERLAGDLSEVRHLGGDLLLYDRASRRGEVVSAEQVGILDEQANRAGAAFADWEALYALTDDEQHGALLERFGQLVAATLERYAAVRTRVARVPLASAWGLVALLQDEAFAFLAPLCASAVEVAGDEVDGD
jgi:hypothetical protein